MRQIFWLYGLLLLSSLVEGWISHVNASPLVLMITSAIDAIVVCGFAAVHRNKVGKLLARPNMDQRCVAELVTIAGLAIILLSLYFSLVQSAGIPIIQISVIFAKYGWPRWSMFALVCLTPAIFEELAFRGVIQTNLEAVLGSREALLIQAALFSGLHLSPVILASHFFMGLVLGIMRTRSRSLYPGMLFHATWNALVLIEEIYLK